jgi:hypothetical protein
MPGEHHHLTAVMRTLHHLVIYRLIWKLLQVLAGFRHALSAGVDRFGIGIEDNKPLASG